MLFDVSSLPQVTCSSGRPVAHPNDCVVYELDDTDPNYSRFVADRWFTPYSVLTDDVMAVVGFHGMCLQAFTQNTVFF